MHVQPKPINRYPWFIRLFIAKQKHTYGAVPEYTEQETYTEGRVTDVLMTELRAHFDEDTIVELTGLIAFQNLSSKFNAALDIPPQGFCQMPDLKTDA